MFRTKVNSIIGEKKVLQQVFRFNGKNNIYFYYF